ncbi:MAG TPA: hypothetical protein VGF28_17215 [Thermoanaerobaculia bacterium]|jgi:hypothetical protein
MRSTARVEPLDTFETDVPVTAADNEALWRARRLNEMSPEEYLEFLVTFTENVPASRETNSDSDEPFEL